MLATHNVVPGEVLRDCCTVHTILLCEIADAETSEVIVPPHHEAMGAIGAAILAMEEMGARRTGTEFKGFDVSEAKYVTSPFECRACPNLCEIARISLDGQIIARCGGRCDIWERKPATQPTGI